MAINYSLFSAISGLTSSSDGMNVIANNIANANTKSFKTDRAEFEDILAISLNEDSQLGRGSRVRNVSTIFNQGTLGSTGQITDMGIQGDGFFVVKNDRSEVKESNGLIYTRQGSFRFDRDGKLVDALGGKVQGYMVDGEGTALSPKLGDLTISSSHIQPRATSIVNVVANLDVREKPPTESFDIKRPGETSNFTTAVTIYDNFGYGRQAYIYFSRTPDSNKNAWEWHAVVDGKEVSTDPAKDSTGKILPAEIAKGNLEFDPQGNPILPYITKAGIPAGIDTVDKKDAFDIQFTDGSKPQKIQFNFGPTIGEDFKVGAQASSSIAAKSGVVFHSQDGYETGYIKNLKIDVDGVIRGVYTNGLERRLGAIALASFPSNHGLQKIGRNNYVSTPKAGEPRIGLAQTGTRGSIYSSSLEESNVDLAQQFVDMIVTQRVFQANSKSITTTDTMMEEVINLKR